jgi:hypothetical protein
MPVHVTTTTTQSLSNKTFVDRLSTTGVVFASGGNSDQWNSTYSTVQTNSAAWGTGGGGGSGAYLPLSGGTLTGTLSVISGAPRSALSNSTLTFTSTSSPNNTSLLNKDNIVFDNGNYSATLTPDYLIFKDPANNEGRINGVSINYSGGNSYIQIFDINDTLSRLSKDNIQFSTETTNVTLQQNPSQTGSITLNLPTVSGTLLTEVSANQWNGTYSTVQSNSATNWNYQGTDIKALTGNWQGTYSTVGTFSATWGGTFTTNSTVSTFTTNGTWTNPSPGAARPVTVILVGGGGGAGSANSATGATAKAGGAGGGGGALVMFNTWTNLLSPTESITVGAGGTGGAGRGGSGNGNPGVIGGDTIMTLAGNALKAEGGNFGAGGTTTAPAGGAARANASVCFNSLANTLPGGAGSSGAANAATLAAATYFQPSGGGGGGGVNTTNAVLYTAAAGGSFFTAATLNLFSGAAVGVGQGASGSNGYSYLGVGAGGAGGNSSITAGVSGGAGGNGGFPGGGGGGGGAYGNATSGGSGAGGNGGDGVATIIVY